MNRVNIVVEGQAEETFVQEVLSRHLASVNVAIVPRRVEFSRRKGRIYRGGLLDYARLKKDVVNWLNQDITAKVTTMVDLYALPDNFPGRGEGARIHDANQRVAHLEAAFAKDIGSTRFLPNIQQHEFEALLFTNIAKLSDYYPKYTIEIQKLVDQASQYANPEQINEGKTTAPSKRILNEIPIYDKVSGGSVLVIDLGLPFIRSRCPHFDAWITKLESLGQAT